jgi:hypothetical protein
MFIPNKTYHAIKVAILCVIAVLVMIIAGQFVLYIQLAEKNTVAIQELQSKIDTLTTTTTSFDNTSLKKHTVVENQITDAVTAILELKTTASELQTSVDILKSSTDMLIVNECKVMPYYMDKNLMATCRGKGF